MEPIDTKLARSILEGKTEEEIGTFLIEEGHATGEHSKLLESARKQLPFVRRESNEEGVELTDSEVCDLCSTGLQPAEQELCQLHWQQIRGKNPLFSMLSLITGRYMGTEQSDLFGEYFLCRGCRSKVRPGGFRVVGIALKWSLIGIVLGALLAGVGGQMEKINLLITGLGTFFSW